MIQSSKSLNKVLDFVTRNEPWLFWALILCHLIPVLSVETFITVDGPAHLYNSRILVELISDSTSPLHEYYAINSTPNPNWTGHFILSALMAFMPSLLAEKVLLISYLVLLPLSFRYLIKSTGAANKVASYFIFPFCYSFLLMYGFYNFQIGLVVLFFSLGYYLKSENAPMSLRSGIVLGLFGLLLFFSHLFVFLMFLAVVGFLNLQKMIVSPKAYRWKRALVLLVIFIPSLGLTILYISANPLADGDPMYLGMMELWSLIQDVQPAKAMSYGKEAVIVQWIFYTLIILTAYLTITRLRNVKASFSAKATDWLMISLAVLLGMFIFPDSSTGSVGFVSSRLALFFLLFFAVFIGTQKLPMWLRGISVVFILYVSFGLLNIYLSSTQKLNALSAEICEVAEEMDEFSVVLTINENDHWIYGHASNYAGVSKPLILLENYEASMNHFPVKWKENEKLSDLLLMQQKGRSGATYSEQSFRGIDYILLLENGKEDRRGAVAENFAEGQFLEVYDGEFVTLYRMTSAKE